jgi:nucleoside triphosphate pyrophosphatase
MQNMNIILASSSPRRQQILSCLVDEFEIKTADLDEKKFIPLACTPEELVTKLALAKAKKVIANHKVKDSLIIAGDTVVVFDPGISCPDHSQTPTWQVIGKPDNLEHAKKTLKLLRGQTHQIYTGIALINQKTNQITTDFSLSHLIFKSFSDKLLDEYIDKFKPLDKAGAYALFEMDDRYAEKFEGSFTGITGLPTENLIPLLQQFKIKIKTGWEEKVKKIYNPDKFH